MIGDDDDALAETLSSNSNSNSSSNITSVLNYNYKGIPLFYSTIIPSAFELFERAKLIKEETNDIVLIKVDKNKMKFKMEKRCT